MEVIDNEQREREVPHGEGTSGNIETRAKKKGGNGKKVFKK